MPQSEHERWQPDYRASLAAYERAYHRYKHVPSRDHLDAWLAETHTLHLALLLPGRFPLGQASWTPRTAG